MPLCNQPTKSGHPCKHKCAKGESCSNHKDACAICFEVALKRDEVILACGHRFHYECLHSWSLAQVISCKSCPTCRAQLPDELQWPKKIETRLWTWTIKNKRDADSYLSFIDKRGLEVAEEMQCSQLHALVSIVTGNANKDICFGSDGAIMFVYKWRIRSDLVVPFTIPERLIGVINMYTEMQLLRARLEALV